MIGAQVFSRRGVEKDERARAIEEQDIERLRKDQEDEIRIIRDSAMLKVRELLVGKKAANRVADERRKQVWLSSGDSITDETLTEIPQRRWKEVQISDSRVQDAGGSDLRQRRRAGDRHQDRVRREDRAPEEGRRAAARRLQDGQGVRRHQAQAVRRRQDGRTSRQQGRDLAHHARGGHALPRRRIARRRRAEPARCAVAHERGADPRDPSRVGGPRPGRAGQRDSSSASTRTRSCGRS